MEDATSVVVFLFTDQHDLGVSREALREAGRLSAHRADRGKHRDAVGDRQERRSGAGERVPGEGLVQDDEDHASPGLAEPPNETDKLVIEELRFVDPDDLDVVRDELSHLGDRVNRIRHEPAAAVARDSHRIVASGIVGVLEHDQLLLGVLRTTQAPNELFRLAAEHAAGDGVDRTCNLAGVRCCGHERSPGDRCILDDLRVRKMLCRG